MKNILLSVVVSALVVLGGYYLFRDNKKDFSEEIIKVSTNFNTDTSSESLETKTVMVSSSGQPISNVIKNDNSNNQIKKSNMVKIETNYGVIVLEMYKNDAPKTVENFTTLAQKGFYNNLTFHRVIKGFMIQGGDPSGNGTGGPGYKFEDELNPNTDSYKNGYNAGVVAMANSGPNTNGSQFFIMHVDYPLPHNYTIFGRVVSGQEIVNKIANVPTGANDMPISPVVMKSVTVE